MKIKTDDVRAQGLWQGVLVLLTGIAIGLVARPADWLLDGVAETADSGPDVVELRVPMARDDGSNEGAFPAAAQLEKLSIDVAPEFAERLQAVYDRSWKSGMIVKQEDDLVPATIRAEGKTVDGQARIKGDYLDHLSTPKWSLRVELESDKLFGMRRFSIQHPKTRGFLWEWLIMTVARRDGLITPRVAFVDVAINGNPLGIYYLEEHFTKELLEAQGRREGPIVRFDEAALMEVYEKYVTKQHDIPETVRPGTYPTTAEIVAFGEKRLAQSETLSRGLERAIAKLSVMQAGVLERALVGGSQEAIAQARERAGDETLASAFDLDSAARMHALLALFRTSHGLGWKDRHYYYNPITDRLEPIINDTLAGTLDPTRDPLAMYTHTNDVFLENDEYYNLLFQHLAELADPAWLTGVFDEVEDDLRRYSAIMAAEGIVDAGTDVDAILEQLWDQQVYLQELLQPPTALGVDGRLYGDDDTPGGDLVIDLWATTRVPVMVHGFRFQNDRFVEAADVIAADARGWSTVPSERGSVVLPHDDRHTAFNFPADVRLATLEDVDAVKDAVLETAEKDQSVKLRVAVEYRFLTTDGRRSEVIPLRRFGRTWLDEGRRPEPPSVDAALEKHGFLERGPASGELRVKPGEWDVDGDLVVPREVSLVAGPGTVLRFDGHAALVSGEPLRFEGSAAEPIRLEPKPGVASWAGVSVLEAPGPSEWRHVHVRDTDVIQRGGWTMTGGITFYRSEVSLYDCRFEDAHGEDALNIYGSAFVMQGVVIDGVASDAFDGDFVRGTVRGCTFRNSVEDAVDVSGSDIDVVDCRFVAIGDKAVSAGENSVVRARDCVVESASIGLASKDFSRLTASGIDIRRAVHYGIAVYIKKPEFGPSSVVADDIRFGEMGLGRHIVQHPCELVVDGETFPGTELDVKALYEQKILGQ